MFRLLLWCCLLAALGLLFYGIYNGRLLEAATWTPAGMRRFARYTVAFSAGSLLFFLFARRYLAVSIVALGAACTAYTIGVPSLTALALFILSCSALGRALFGSGGVVSFLAGLGIWAFAMALVARLPIHYSWAYFAVVVAVLIVLRQQSLELCRAVWATIRPAPYPATGAYWAFCLFAFVMTAHWLVVLKPEASADGLAMHLAIAWNMGANHAFTIDFHRYIWALMPMGADFCYAVAYSLGGEYAARLLNLAMLAAIAALLYDSARVWISDSVALLLTTLFISAPLVQLVTGSMMVDNFAAALLLGAGVALWRFHDQPSVRTLLLSAWLMGSAVGWKLGSVAVAAAWLPCLCIAMAQRWRSLGAHPLLACLAAAAVLLIPAALPYAHAYAQTGNPIFPFENARFPSPLLTDDLRDDRFQEPLTISTPARITFKTSRYYEGQDGSFGFQYLFLLPLCLASLPRFRSLRQWSPFVIGLTGFAVIGWTQPNARYFYVALPFLVVASAAALSQARSVDMNLFRTAIVGCVLVAGLNIWFLPTSNFYHRDFVLKPLFSDAGRREYRKAIAPVRDAIDFVNRAGTPVMFTQTSEIAGVQVPFYSSHWHNYSFRKQVEACPRAQDAYRLVTSLKIQRFIAPRDASPGQAAETPGMSRFLEICTETEFQEGDYLVRRLLPDCEAKLHGAP